MKKITCLILGLLFVGTMLLSACDGGDGNTSSTDTASTVSNNGKYVADIPEKDYGGQTFTFLTCGPNAEHDSEIVYNEYADDAVEKLPEVVNNAISTRNAAVEEKLNVKIKEQYVFDAKRKNGEFANKVRNDLAAGLSEYQVIVPCIYDAATLTTDGCLYDLLNDIPYLKMSQPWWDQTYNAELTINGNLYCTVGDIGFINKGATAALFYNKALIEQNNLENPYELVRDGKWALDKVTEMAKAIGSDDNGDGKIDYKDSMGWSGQLDDMWHLFYGSGEKIATVGSDGFPQLTMYNERSAGVIEDMQALVQDKTHYISANDYFGEAKWPTTLTIQPFLAGRCLFFSALIDSTGKLDGMEDDFGIVPIPKYDEAQTAYHSLINPWVSTCFAVPTSVPEENLEYVGIVLEALGAESRNYVQPAYYEVALKYQKTRDDDSIEMLDIIFESRGCDLGIMYAWGGLDTMLQGMASKAPGTFTSAYDAAKNSAQNALDATVEYFKEIE